MPWKRVFIIWCLIAALEAVQDLLSRLLLEPRIGQLAVNHAGVFIGLLLVFLICLATSRWIGPRSKLGWMLIGAVWAVLTVGFECLLGRATGLSWNHILAGYDPARGGLLGLELIGMIYAPRFAARLRGTQT